MKEFVQKDLMAILLFEDVSKTFDSIHRVKMNQILLVYGLPKGAVTAIMIFYRITNAKVRSLDEDMDTFNIVAGVPQGDTLAPYLFIMCQDNEL